jgi:hypothetical protein
VPDVFGPKHVKDLLIGSYQFVQVGSDGCGIQEHEILLVEFLAAY